MNIQIISKEKALCAPTQLSDISQLQTIDQETIIIDLNEIDDLEYKYYYKSFKSGIVGCIINLEKEKRKNIIVWENGEFKGGALSLIRNSK